MSDPSPPDSSSVPPPGVPAVERGEDGELVETAAGRVGIPRSRVGVVEIFAGMLLVIVIVTLLASVIAIAFDPGLGEGEESPESNLRLQFAVVAGMIAGAVVVSAWANREGLWQSLPRLGLRAGPPGLVASSVLIAFGLYLVAALAVNLSLGPEQEDIAESLGATREADVLTKVLAGVVIIAGASLAEELLFRGLIFGGLRQRMSLWPAAAISGVLFGAVHLTAGNLAVAIQLAAFGVILAWAYERSGTLWTPIILHAFNNTVAFSLLVSDVV